MITYGLGLDGQYMQRYLPEVHALLQEPDARHHLSIVNAELLGHENVQRVADRFGRVVHHLSNVASTGIHGPNLRQLDELNKTGDALGAEWCCEDAGIWNVGPFNLPYFAPPPLTGTGLSCTIDGVRKIMGRAGRAFALEVPTFAFVYGDMPLEDFFTAVCDATGVSLVLDTGHLYSYCLATGRQLEDVWKGFPIDSVLELHVAGGRVAPERPRRYIDTHAHPVLPEVWHVVRTALKDCRHLKAATYEVGVRLQESDFRHDFGKLAAMIEEFNATEAGRIS